MEAEGRRRRRHTLKAEPSHGVRNNFDQINNVETNLFAISQGFGRFGHYFRIPRDCPRRSHPLPPQQDDLAANLEPKSNS